MTLHYFNTGLIFLLAMIGALVPLWYEFGVPFFGGHLYFEDILLGILFLFFIIKLFFIGKIARHHLLLIATLMFFTLYGVMIGLLSRYGVGDILKDVRVPLYIVFISVLFYEVMLSEATLTRLLRMIVVLSVPYTLMIGVSVHFETFLYHFKDEGMTLGLQRLSYGNELLFILSTIPLAVWVKAKKLPMIYLVTLLSMALLLTVLSERRGIFVMLLLSGVAVAFILEIVPKNVRFSHKVLYGFLAFLGAIVMLGMAYSGGMFDRFINIQSEGSFMIRSFSIIENFQRALERPFTGHGFGSMLLVSIESIGGVHREANIIDNSYVTILYKFGFIMGPLYLFFLLKTMASYLSGFESKIRNVILLAFVFYGAVGAYMIAGSRLIIYFFLVLFLCTQVHKHVLSKGHS